MAIDPVCGMAVTVTPTTPMSEHQGFVYFFCAAVCKRRFDKDPDGVLGAAVRSGKGHPPASAARARQLGRLLRRLARQLADPVDEPEGTRSALAPVEHIAVVEVGERRRVMMSELAQACGMALSTMTGLADRLEKKGVLRRVRSDADRRVVFVELTSEGERAYRERLEADMRIVIGLLDALSSREQVAVVRALDKLTAALEGAESPRYPPEER